MKKIQKFFIFSVLVTILLLTGSITYIYESKKLETSGVFNSVVQQSDESFSCDGYKDKFQTSLNEMKKERETNLIFGNNSIIQEIFYSKNLSTCVAVVEIKNFYQKPSSRRMYATDIINNRDLFSTDEYICNGLDDCDNPKYQNEKNKFYIKVGSNGGKVVFGDIVKPSFKIGDDIVTIYSPEYGTVQTFQINKNTGTVRRDDKPFINSYDYVKEFSGCSILNIENWNCGDGELVNSFGFLNGVYYWWILGENYGLNFTVLK